MCYNDLNLLYVVSVLIKYLDLVVSKMQINENAKLVLNIQERVHTKGLGPNKLEIEVNFVEAQKDSSVISLLISLMCSCPI